MKAKGLQNLITVYNKQICIFDKYFAFVVNNFYTTATIQKKNKYLFVNNLI